MSWSAVRTGIDDGDGDDGDGDGDDGDPLPASVPP
jgi:hypothetical protein